MGNSEDLIFMGVVFSLLSVGVLSVLGAFWLLGGDEMRRKIAEDWNRG